MLDTGTEDEGIDSAVNRQRRSTAVPAQATNPGRGAALVPRETLRATRSGGRASIPARHCRMHGCLTKEFQALHLTGRAAPPMPGALVRIAFTSGSALFLRGKGKRGTARHAVASLTVTCAVSPRNWRNSSRGASGSCFTCCARSCRGGVLKLAGAPPPCGRGVRSPRSRHCRSLFFTHVCPT